jgi:hypothetical protein
VTSPEPPSLLGVTIRRSFSTGRFFLGYGTVVSLVLGAALAVSGGSAFPTTFPFLLPIFVVVGSMGGMVVFTNDRIKGVLEYLLAYGFSPRRLFVTFLVAVLALAGVVLAVAVGFGVSVYLATGHALTVELAELLGFYGVPMGLVSAAFGATVGMFWTSLSSPRSGMNSPIGLIPFVGILPSLVTLFLLVTLAEAGLFSGWELPYVALGMMGAILAVVVTLLATMGRFLRRERLLSPS